jgi:hypothetical protein
MMQQQLAHSLWQSSPNDDAASLYNFYLRIMHYENKIKN